MPTPSHIRAREARAAGSTLPRGSAFGRPRAAPPPQPDGPALRTGRASLALVIAIGIAVIGRIALPPTAEAFTIEGPSPLAVASSIRPMPRPEIALPFPLLADPANATFLRAMPRP